MEQKNRAGRPKKNAAAKTGGKNSASAKKIPQGDIIFALDIGTKNAV